MGYNDFNNMLGDDNLPYYEDAHANDGAYSERLRSYQQQTPFYGNAPQGATPYNTGSSTKEVKSLKNLMVYEPKTEMDSTTVIDFLKNKEPAIINLNSTAPEIAQRILDFSSGAVYALNGTVHKIAENIFLLLPQGIEITNFDRGNDE